MNYLILSAMSFSFTLFVALFQKLGKARDDKTRRIRSISKKNIIKTLDEEIELPFMKRFLLPAVLKTLKAFSKIFPKDKKEAKKSKLEQRLLLAGITITPGEFSSARLIFTVGTLALTVLILVTFKNLVALKFLLYLSGTILALYGLHAYVSARIKKRQGAIRKQMPDIMDLLTVSVEAGLGFDAALLYIAQYSKGPLVDEFGTVQKEIQMGRPRREALKRLAERTNVQELKTFVGALIQTEQMGVSIKNVLQAQASQLRLSRKQAAEEKAMKAPIKMMFPLVVFIFPVIFIILLGPTVLQIIEVFKE